MSTFFHNYAIAGTSLVYGRFLGDGADGETLKGFIKTSGSSTTTTRVDTTNQGATPFAGVAAGDHLLVATGDPGTASSWLRRSVATWTSTSQVSVDSAWDLSGNSGNGYAAKLLPFRSGTTTSDGWVFCGAGTRKNIQINPTTIGASTGIIYSIEARLAAPADPTKFVVVFTGTIPTANAGTNLDFTITEDWAYIRVGLKESGTTGTNAISAYMTMDTRLGE
jgi:hypothetical protein